MNATAVMGVVLAMGMCITFGCSIVAAFLPPSLSRRWICLLGPGIGLGATSLLFFVFRRPIFTVEFTLVLPALWLLVRNVHITKRLSACGSIARPTIVLGLILLIAAGFVLAASIVRINRMPHGYWDGWAIWDTHARLLYRDGRNWKADIPYTFHPDYPQLTSSFTARLWRYAGEEIPEAGALSGLVLLFSAMGVLAMTLSDLRDSSLGLLMALVLAGTPLYLDHGTSHFADVPLSFFILSSIALMCLHFEREFESPGILILAGFTAGCAGWTKNEGLLFIIAVYIALLSALAIHRLKIFRPVAAFSAGLLLPLSVILLFKLFIAPQTDLIEYQYKTMDKIQDLNRYFTIFHYFVQNIWTFGVWSINPLMPLVAYIALRGFNRRTIQNSGWLAGFITLLMMLGGYFAVYVITPLPLDYHLSHSFDRLMLHLWPSFLLLFGLCAKKRPASRSVLEWTVAYGFSDKG